MLVPANSGGVQNGITLGTPVTVTGVSRATQGFNTKDIHTFTGNAEPTMVGKTFIGYWAKSSAAASFPIDANFYWLLYYVSSISTGASDTYTLYPMFIDA